MLNEKVKNALNAHISKEFYSAYLYMSMSAHSSSIGLSGFEKWFMSQYHEEMAHAMTLYEYLKKQGEKIKLLEVKEPPTDFESPIDMFEKTLEHEKLMTENINDLVNMAMHENDHATRIIMQWFVTEQVEEENMVGNILNRLKLVGSDTNGLFLIDNELAGRAVNAPLDFSNGVDLTAG